MLRQSSIRNHRSKRLRPRHSFQLFLLVAVGVWVVYQLAHSYGKRQRVVVETDDLNNGVEDGEPARRRLGRKGFIDFAGHAYEDGIVGVRGGGDAGSEDDERGGASSDDPLGKAGDHDEGDQEAEEDDGVEDADDGLAADEEEDDRDFQSQNGSSEEELKTMNDETDGGREVGNGLHQPSELNLNSSIVPRANATGRVQDGATVPQVNATDGASAADGRLSLDDSALKNTSSVDVSLHDPGTTGSVPKKSLVRALGANNEKQMTNKNGTADSVTGHGTSS